jgi:hypothetical protein
VLLDKSDLFYLKKIRELLQMCTQFCCIRCVGPGSSVGIATDYGLDGPEIESRWGEIFHPSRPALGPTQPPVQWVPGCSRW